MASHGSKRYRNMHVRYDPNDLKLIRELWLELLTDYFKPEPKLSLDSMLEGRIGKSSMRDARQILRESGRDLRWVYRNHSGHEREIPRRLLSLAALALATNNYAFRVESDTFYLNSG